ncbi:uncharacterized protein F4822DRAFT_34669 [Hypoxylon trugodes]|uniref:uncharacterized protein n=1 Tax=Hypoxylon trugodes TaxID=326681 RepID=UPI00219E6C4D|nr:uncharacterized protein F4822DRAFT_34669 [Hypoxylon trugodes]KAI1394043.1 hypothetical protein F4822DRAFT_34669 [Hypoxylon trugodes]
MPAAESKKVARDDLEDYEFYVQDDENGDIVSVNDERDASTNVEETTPKVSADGRDATEDDDTGEINNEKDIADDETIVNDCVEDEGVINKIVNKDIVNNETIGEGTTKGFDAVGPRSEQRESSLNDSGYFSSVTVSKDQTSKDMDKEKASREPSPDSDSSRSSRKRRADEVEGAEMEGPMTRSRKKRLDAARSASNSSPRSPRSPTRSPRRK